MLYTHLVLRVRLVVVELVDAYRREHRVEDRELTRGEAADHDAESLCALSFRAYGSPILSRGRLTSLRCS